MTRTLNSLRRAGAGRRPLAMILVLLLLLAACSGGGGDDSEAATQEVADDAEFAPEAVPEEAAAEAALGLADEAAAGDPASDGADEPAAGASDEERGTDVAQADGGDLSAAPPSTAATGERIIKEGTVTVQIEPGDFDVSFGQIVSRAQALGGHVSGTSSSTDPGPDDTTLTSGQVTIRIPVRNFEDLLTSLGDAGEVVDRNISSQDVTAEFTDLESRRRNLQAQERFYLGLLEEAQGVNDAIAVQQQLDGIQSQIEQITGRLNLLEDRTAFSTLTVLIQERGATAADPVVDEPGGLAPYIDQAIETLISTVGGLIVVATFLLPFIVILAFAYVVWRTIFRRRTTDAQGVIPDVAPPAAPEPPRESVDA